MDKIEAGIIITGIIIIFKLRAILGYIRKNAIQHCGECLKYKKCWGKFNMTCYETPACSGFKEKK